MTSEVGAGWESVKRMTKGVKVHWEFCYSDRGTRGDDILDWEQFPSWQEDKVVDAVNDKIQEFRAAKFCCVLHMHFVK